MAEELIGLIPAAGKGVRLGLPYPKELYPIIRDNRFKPIAQFVVENLTTSGVQHIVFVVNETKHQLIGYFGDGSRFNCSFSYVVQEHRGDGNSSTSPGLAHALASAHHLVRGKTVCFGMADTIIEPVDVFGRLLAAARPEDQIVLGLFPVTRPEKSGMVDYDSDGCVRRVVDKPSVTDLQHGWACIAWRPGFGDFLYESACRRHVADFATILNNAIAAGMACRGVVLDQGHYSDLGTYDEIAELERKSRS